MSRAILGQGRKLKFGEGRCERATSRQEKRGDHVRDEIEKAREAGTAQKKPGQNRRTEVQVQKKAKGPDWKIKKTKRQENNVHQESGPYEKSKGGGWDKDPHETKEDI